MRIAGVTLVIAAATIHFAVMAYGFLNGLVALALILVGAHGP